MRPFREVDCNFLLFRRERSCELVCPLDTRSQIRVRVINPTCSLPLSGTQLSIFLSVAHKEVMFEHWRRSVLLRKTLSYIEEDSRLRMVDIFKVGARRIGSAILARRTRAVQTRGVAGQTLLVGCRRVSPHWTPQFTLVGNFRQSGARKAGPP